MKKKGKVFGVPNQIFVGFRHEKINLISTNWDYAPASLTWNEPKNLGFLSSQKRKQVNETSSKEYVLPSLSYNIDISDDLKTRISYNESISRPKMSQLESLHRDYSKDYSDTIWVTRGNPYLKPISSQSFDWSLEWYFGETNLFGLNLFSKKIDNIVYTKKEQGPHLNLRDPRYGERAEAATSSLIAEGVAEPNLDDIWHFIVVEENDTDGLRRDEFESVFRIDQNNGDPLYSTEITTYENNKSTEYSGYEINIQYFHQRSGLGFSGNYTKISGSDQYDRLSSSNAEPFALFGISDTFNVAGIYSKDHLEMRLALNWRGKYLDSLSKVPIDNYPWYDERSAPSFTEERHQIDLSVRYQLTEYASLIFDGINLTGENTRTHARNERQLLRIEDLGASYRLGFRLAFE